MMTLDVVNGSQEQQHPAKSKYASAVQNLETMPPTSLVCNVPSSDVTNLSSPALKRGVSTSTSKNKIPIKDMQPAPALLALNAFKESLPKRPTSPKSSQTNAEQQGETKQDKDLTTLLPPKVKRGISVPSAKSQISAKGTNTVQLGLEEVKKPGLTKAESFRIKGKESSHDQLIKTESFRKLVAKPIQFAENFQARLSKPGYDLLLDRSLTYGLTKEQIAGISALYPDDGEEEKQARKEPDTEESPEKFGGKAEEENGSPRHFEDEEISPNKRTSRGTYRERHHDKAVGVRGKVKDDSPSVSPQKRSEGEEEITKKRSSRGTNRGRHHDKGLRGRGVDLGDSNRHNTDIQPPSMHSKGEEEIVTKRASRRVNGGRNGKSTEGSGADTDDSSPRNSPGGSPSKCLEDNEYVVKKRIRHGIKKHKPDDCKSNPTKSRVKTPRSREITDSSRPSTVVKKLSSSSLVEKSLPRNRSRTPSRAAIEGNTRTAEGEEEIPTKRISRARDKEAACRSSAAASQHRVESPKPAKSQMVASSHHHGKGSRSRSKTFPVRDTSEHEKRISSSKRSGHRHRTQDAPTDDSNRISRDSRRYDTNRRSPHRVRSDLKEILETAADDRGPDVETEVPTRVRVDRSRAKHQERHTYQRRVRKVKSQEDTEQNQLAPAIVLTHQDRGSESDSDEPQGSDTCIYFSDEDEEIPSAQEEQNSTTMGVTHSKTTRVGGVALLKTLASKTAKTTLNAGMTFTSTTANVTAAASTTAVKTTLNMGMTTVKTTFNVGTTTALTGLNAFSTLSSAATSVATSALHQGKDIIYGDGAKKMMTEGLAPGQNLAKFVEEKDPGTIENVTHSWKKMKKIRNYEEKAGIQLFTHLFEHCPAAKGIFGFPSDSDPRSDELRSSPAFKQHSTYLIQMIDKALDLLTMHKEEPQKLQTALFDLGKKHSRLGVEREYFVFMGAALLETLRKMLGKSTFTVDVEKCWTLVYNVLASEMCHGIASDNIVLETWAKVKSTPLYKENVGFLIFKNLFEQCPESKKLFGLPPDLGTEIHDMKSTRFRMHTEYFIVMFDKALHMVEAHALDKHMEELAEKHVQLGVKAEYFPVMGEGLFHALKVQLKNDFTDDVRDAWLSTYSRMSSKIVALMRSITHS